MNSRMLVPALDGALGLSTAAWGPAWGSPPTSPTSPAMSSLAARRNQKLSVSLSTAKGSRTSDVRMHQKLSLGPVQIDTSRSPTSRSPTTRSPTSSPKIGRSNDAYWCQPRSPLTRRHESGNPACSLPALRNTLNSPCGSMSPTGSMSPKGTMRRRSAHTTSYSDLLSSAWRPGVGAALANTCPAKFVATSTEEPPRTSMHYVKNYKEAHGMDIIQSKEEAKCAARSSSVPVALSARHSCREGQRTRISRPTSGVRLAPVEAQITHQLATTLTHLKAQRDGDAWASEIMDRLKKSSHASAASTASPDSKDTTGDRSDLGCISSGRDTGEFNDTETHAKVVTLQRVPRLTDPDLKFVMLRGAPSFNEALERLRAGSASSDEHCRVRKVFSRFACGDEDLDREWLEQVLCHLGYVAVDEDIVESLADKVTDLSSLDLQEFVAFLDAYAASETDALKAAFNKQACAKATSSTAATISVDEIPAVMRDLKIIILRDALEELLQRADLASQRDVNYDQLVQVMSAYHTCEGFTATSLTELQESFAKEAVDERLTITNLPNALLDFFGVHCIKHLRELLDAAGKVLTEPGSLAIPIYVHEFVVWARCLRNLELTELYQSFDNVDGDSDGAISFEELMSMMKQEGFTLSNSEAQEILHAASLSDTQVFSFDDATKYVSACRKSEGFCKNDFDEFITAYKLFDTEDTGEITKVQVLDLLRHLGYQVGVGEVERYANQVDFNGNGTMDVDEFLRLARLHHEDEVEGAHKIFMRFWHSSQKVATWANCKVARLPLCSLAAALRVCTMPYDGFDELCRQAVESSTTDLSFDEFRILSHRCRKASKLAQIQRANFSDEEIATLLEVFQRFDVGCRGVLDSVQMSVLLHQCGIPQHTESTRKAAMAIVDKARCAALDAGVTCVGNTGTFSATFWIFVHVCRVIARTNESASVTRVEDARRATSFTALEVEEFNKVFATWATSGAAQDVPSEVALEPVKFARRNSFCTSQKDVQPAPDTTQKEEGALSLEVIVRDSSITKFLTFGSLKDLLGHLRLKLGPSNSWTLQSKLEGLTRDREGALDFANFLYLMRWMLDTNFASLSAATAANTAPTVAKSDSGGMPKAVVKGAAIPVSMGRRASV